MTDPTPRRDPAPEKPPQPDTTPLPEVAPDDTPWEVPAPPGHDTPVDRPGAQ